MHNTVIHGYLHMVQQTLVCYIKNTIILLNRKANQKIKFALNNIKDNFMIKYSQLIACESGLYGVDCNETCGHCKDVTQCFHVNGTCLTGCKPGYQDELCRTGEKVLCLMV